MTAARDPNRSLWLGLALIALPSLALLGVEIFQGAAVIPDVRQSQDQVVHTLDVIARAQAVDHAIQDAERGQRGYLITGDPAYLEPYQIGIKTVAQKLDELGRLTVDNSEQQKRIALLRQQLDIKLSEMRRTIEVFQGQGYEPARKIVKSNLGNNTMNTIAAQLGLAISSENDLLRERQARAAQAVGRDARVTEIGGALAALVMVWGSSLLLLALRREGRARRGLVESEERFRLLVEGAKDHAIYMLDNEGRVASWNEGAERIKGYKSDEIIGRHVSVFYTPEDRAAREPERVLATTATSGSFAGEGWRVRKDGARFWASVTLTALRNADGSLRGFGKITRDLNTQRQQQDALDRSREELTQAQKMQAVGQLTGGVAHDFNNLLTAISGSLDLLERDCDALGSVRGVRLLDTAKRAAEQGTALTQRLLAFSRQQMLSPQIVDLNRLVAGMSDLLRRPLGENIGVETVLAGGLWRARVDQNQFQTALLNLALNARDAMPNGGKLTIETGNSYLEEEYAAAHAEVTPGQYVLIAVTDTGTGMTAETMQHAFEPFYTTKHESQGTGLGLSQVFGFIKQSGGHIKLYSELGQGTTVKIYLPRSVEAEQPEPGRPQPMIATTQSETVLLVEDDANVREFSAYALEHLGYRVHEAADATTALQALDQHPEIVLLFTDVGLPGLNGRQLAEEARRRAPHLKILYTTGYARNAIVHSGILDHGVELLVKPFTVEALGRRLNEMLRGASTAPPG